MFHETPDKLLLSSIESFEIEPDLLTLRRIEEVINRTNQYRSNIIEKYETKLNTIKSEYHSLLTEINFLTKVSGINYENLKALGKGDEEYLGDLNNKNIFNVMNEKSIELDNLKFSLAKNLNDLESQINSMNITRKDLIEKYELVKMKNDNLINDNILKNPDSKAIKINIYKNLGIEIDSGKESGKDSELGNQDKVIIYNKETNLSSILNIDDKYSEFFITNYVWDRLQGY